VRFVSGSRSIIDDRHRKIPPTVVICFSLFYPHPRAAPRRLSAVRDPTISSSATARIVFHPDPLLLPCFLFILTCHPPGMLPAINLTYVSHFGPRGACPGAHPIQHVCATWCNGRSSFRQRAISPDHRELRGPDRRRPRNHLDFRIRDRPQVLD